MTIYTRSAQLIGVLMSQVLHLILLFTEGERVENLNPLTLQNFVVPALFTWMIGLPYWLARVDHGGPFCSAAVKTGFFVRGS